MTHYEAEEILHRYLQNNNLLKHCLAAEAAMKGLARYFGEDEEKWGITGLLHDADYEMSKGHPEKHGMLLFEKMKDDFPEDKQIPQEIKHAIQSHTYQRTGVMPETQMDWSITCCDQLTGLIVACALVSPDKDLAHLTNEFVMKKLRASGFAAGADRKQIYMCEDKLGIPLIEFVTICLTSMQDIHESLEL